MRRNNPRGRRPANVVDDLFYDEMDVDHLIEAQRRGERPVPGEDNPRLPQPHVGEINPWRDFGITESMPLVKQVERLYVADMDAEEIARHLSQPVENVQRLIREIENGWKSAGKPLDPEAKELERGRMIAKLEALVDEIERTMRVQPSDRLLSMKLAVMNQLTELRSLKTSAKDVATEDKDEDGFEKAVSELSPEKLARLMEHLALGVP